MERCLILNFVPEVAEAELITDIYFLLRQRNAAPGLSALGVIQVLEGCWGRDQETGVAKS